MQLKLVLTVELVDLAEVFLVQVLNFDGIALVDLWSYYVVDMFFEVINFLEDPSLQLSLSARSACQFIIAVMIIAPLGIALAS